MTNESLRFRALARWFHLPWQMTVACVCLYWYWHPPAPNKAVLVLTGVTVLMALLEMELWQKAVYLLLILCLMGIENGAINKDRADTARTEDERRKEEREKFQGIADGIEQTIKNGSMQFAATMQRESSILTKEEELAALSKKNLENLTGGRAYAIVTPQVWSGLVPIPLTIYNYGKQTLTGVTVTIRGQQAWDFIHNPQNPYSMFQAEASSLNVGTLHPGQMKFLGTTISPTTEKNAPTENAEKVDQYQLDIAAQNFTVTEYLVFKKGKHVPWDFKYTVTRQYIRSQTKRETKFGYEVMAQTDWKGD